MLNKIYETIKKIIKKYGNYIICLLIVFMCLYELPYVVYSPGGAINLSERVNVENGYNSEGKFEMAYVTMRKGNIPNLVLSYIIPNWDILPTKEVTISGQTLNETMDTQKLEMEESVANATINAYKKAGKKISIIKQKVNVIYIDSNAKSELKLGDVILNVNNESVNGIKDIQKIINDKQIGEKINIKVLRNNNEIDTLSEIISIADEPKIGISTITTYEYETDPKIELKTKNSESGPSGGLMMSLAIYNALTDKDITMGKTIIGTGTIDSEGNVGEIDGVKYKLLGAVNKKAEIFIVPKENYEEAIKLKEEKNLNIKVFGVTTFDETIELLSSLD